MNNQEFSWYSDDVYRTGEFFYEKHLVGEYCLAKVNLVKRLSAPTKPVSIDMEKVHPIFPELLTLEDNDELCLPKSEWVSRLKKVGLRFEESLYELFADIILSGEECREYLDSLDTYLDDLESGKLSFRLG